MNKTIKELVADWLQEEGYDGLCHPEIECCCEVAKLATCGELNDECVAAHNEPRLAALKGQPFWMAPGKG